MINNLSSTSDSNHIIVQRYLKLDIRLGHSGDYTFVLFVVPLPVLVAPIKFRRNKQAARRGYTKTTRFM